MNKKLTIEYLDYLLSKRLKAEKPGLEAQLKLCPQPPPSTLTFQQVWPSCLKAAVLVLFYPKDGQIHLIFIKRTHLVQHHQNQISFPGGQLDENESIEEAALRETQEELGLSTEEVKIIGQLTPLYVQSSNFCIFPVVAIARKSLNFQPSKVEVEEIIEVPLHHLLAPENLKQEIWLLRGREALVPFYLFDSHKIWGATAMILAELLEILRVALKEEKRA